MPWLDTGVKQLISIRDQLFTKWLRLWLCGEQWRRLLICSQRDNWMWRLKSSPVTRSGGSSTPRLKHRSTPQVLTSAGRSQLGHEWPTRIGQRVCWIVQIKFSAGAKSIFELHISHTHLHKLLKFIKLHATTRPDGIAAALCSRTRSQPGARLSNGAWLGGAASRLEKCHRLANSQRQTQTRC